MAAALIEIDFSSTGNSKDVALVGFSFPEPFGRWSDGNEAVVELPRPSRYDRLELRLALIPHVIKNHVSEQRLLVAANGREIFSSRFTDSATIRVRLPADIYTSSDRLSLSFKFPDAVSPAAAGASHDVRALGFIFQTLSLIYVNSAAANTPAVPASGPVFHIEGPGQLGNQMIKYLVARKLALQVPGLRISGLSMPEWGVDYPVIPPHGREIILEDLQGFNFTEVADLINIGLFDRVVYRGYGQRLENFPQESHADLFRSNIDDVQVFGTDTLVIHIRGADIMAAAHAHYPLLPVAFYRDIVQITGLRPVFLGQLDANPYIDDLHAAFPDAVFLPPQDRMRDFETMRRAKNILISVSSFSWLAAWLSDANQIFMPVNGLFHPMQGSGVDLLPKHDARFRFFLFPINFAVKVPEHRRLHWSLDGLWREVTGAMLHDIASGSRLYPRRLDDHLEVFDGEFYLSAHGGARDAIAQGTDASPRDHYIRVGFDARLGVIRIDPVAYVSNHVMAAMEIGQGDFEGAEHHFAAVGRRRGYSVSGNAGQ